jgi:hypothetical protein
VVRILVQRGVHVYGAQAKTPTLEDVYFAVEARIAAGGLPRAAAHESAPAAVTR